MFARENRTLWDNVKLGGVFVFLGGYVGVLTSMILGHFVNCMTGNSTETGMSLGHLNFQEFFMFAFIVCCFIFGTFSAAKLIDNTKRGHVWILIAESGILILLGSGILAVVPSLFLASLAMGLQNGMSTYTTWSAGKVRTTHVTGTSTDIGVSLANGDMREFGFTVFQALTYLGGAIFGFFVAREFGELAFAMGGSAILLILVWDMLEQNLMRRALS